MEKFTNKKYNKYDYNSRYISVPYYYDTKKSREVYGIGEPMAKNVPFVSHKLNTEDTLDSLALNYYNNPTYWWIIAYFNNILDPFIHLRSKYTTIKIPNISSIRFENER